MFTIYTSADAGAPALNNVSGSLRAALKAILVDGYPGHAAAGWTMPFERAAGPAGDSDPGVFRPNGGTRQFFRVADNFTFPFNQYDYNAAENMTSAEDAGITDRWGGPAMISARPDGAGAHKWICFADNRTCYFFLESTGGSGLYWMWAIGDFWPYGPLDVWNAFSYNWDSNPPLNGDCASELGGPGYVMRNFDGTIRGRWASGPTGIRLNLHSDSLVSRTQMDATLSGKIAYPDPVSNKIWLAPIYVGGYPGTPHVRGKLRGLWLWLHPATSIADRDAFAGSGDFAGRTFMAVRNVRTIGGGGPSVMIIETSNTVP